MSDVINDYALYNKLVYIYSSEIPNVKVCLTKYHKGNKCIVIKKDPLCKIFNSDISPFIDKITKRYGLIQEGEWDYVHKEYIYYLIIPKENIDTINVLLNIQYN